MPNPFRYRGRKMKMSTGRVQKVQVVKPKRKRRGPKLTSLLKQKLTTKLRYVDTLNLDAGAAGIVSHVFSANGLFDPDITSTGHQPHYYDEFSALYNKYRVLSSKIQVTPILSGTGNVNPALYGVFRDSDSTLNYSLGTAIIEDVRNKGSWGLHAGVSSARGQYGNMTVVKRASFNVKQLTPEGRDDATLTTANPTTGSGTDTYFQIWCASVLGNNPGIVSFLVQIDSVVEFTDPLHLAQS